jgi:hypothetical protein
MLRCEWGHDDCGSDAVEGIVVRGIGKFRIFCGLHILVVKRTLDSLGLPYHLDTKLTNPTRVPAKGIRNDHPTP